VVDAVDRRRVGLHQTAISRTWRTFGLKPPRIEDFKLSIDPQFIDKVRDVVGLYLNPPDAAVVLCVDEKTQVQALDRTAPLLLRRRTRQVGVARSRDLLVPIDPRYHPPCVSRGSERSEYSTS
jgi:hypothetical protein